MSHDCTAGCTAGWSPGRKCHCRGCGQNFSTVGNFDRHLERRESGNRCLLPADCGLEPNRYGVWIKPGEVDFDARFGRKTASA